MRISGDKAKKAKAKLAQKKGGEIAAQERCIKASAPASESSSPAKQRRQHLGTYELNPISTTTAANVADRVCNQTGQGFLASLYPSIVPIGLDFLSSFVKLHLYNWGNLLEPKKFSISVCLFMNPSTTPRRPPRRILSFVANAPPFSVHPLRLFPISFMGICISVRKWAGGAPFQLVKPGETHWLQSRGGRMVSSTTPFVLLSTTHTNTITHKGAPNKDSSSNRAVTPAGSIVSSRIAPISSLCLSLRKNTFPAKPSCHHALC